MTDSYKNPLILTRTINAPREKVWEAWTDPKILSEWWGPNGVSIPTCEFDAKPGGNIYIVMLAGDELGPMKGQKWPMHGSVREVTSPEKIVYSSTALEDPDGTPNMENLVTITFEDVMGKTNMTVRIEITKATAKAGPALAGMETGWNQQLDKLETLLSRSSP